MSRKKIIWICFLIFDLELHKTTNIEILNHLALRGYDTYLVALRSNTRLSKSYDVNPGFHTILFPLKYVPMLTSFLFAIILSFFLPFFILIKKPDFVVIQPGPSIISFIWTPLLNALKIKVILDIRSTPILSESQIRGLLGSLNIVLFNLSVLIAKSFFNGISTLTEGMKRQICSTYQINPNFVGVWTSGTSTTLFNPQKYDKKQIRETHDLTDKFIVFYHGDLTLPRGIIQTVASIKKLKVKNNDIVLFLLGSGSALLTLKDLIRKDNLQKRVILHDAVDYLEVPQYIALCDIGIVPLPDIPDWRNQCPLKLLEYLAMKKVVIATDIPANREILGDNKCGIYISSTDPKEIANAIEYAYSNKKKLDEWGAGGRSIIEKKYSWNKVAEDFEAYLLQL